VSAHTEWLTINYAPNGKTPKAYRIVLVDGEPIVYRPEVDDFGVVYYDEDASHDQEVLGEAVRQLRMINLAKAEANAAPIASEDEANAVDVTFNQLTGGALLPGDHWSPISGDDWSAVPATYLGTQVGDWGGFKFKRPKKTAGDAS